MNLTISSKFFSKMGSKISLKNCLIILFWITVWQAADLFIDNPILFAGPIDIIQALAAQGGSPAFWATIFNSFFRISLGFFCAFFFGLLLGSLAYGCSLIKELLAPLMITVRSVPVASFIILALIWIGSDHLAVFTSFLVVAPMIYTSTLTGLEHTDPKLLEMAHIFRIPLIKKIRFIYAPSLLPYLINGCRLGLGMGWKSGVAAEVIGIPQSSIGEQLYYAKLYLDTASLFSWTFVIIIASALFERLFLFLLKRIRH